MKTLFRILFSLALPLAARATSVTQATTTTTPITITGGRYDLQFGVQWACDDYPQNSAPGRVELLNAGGNVIGRAGGTIIFGSGPQASATLGTISDLNGWVTVHCPNGAPADGELSATWHISGVANGNYTLRFWNYRTDETGLIATTVWTTTMFFGGSSPPAPNAAPTIAWVSAPGSATSGQGYTVTAHGHDDDGNLSQVNVWKDGQPFAFAGGGDGTDGNSGNPTSDIGPRTVMFTAQAVDATGATSPTISWTVTITAANRAPTISWTSAPDNVASGQGYTITAHGHDDDGNLTQVNVWKDNQPFAFAGGGSGYDGDSGNPTSDTGPRTVTFTAQSVDANGATSSVITHTVTIGTANRTPTVSWNSPPATAASGQSYAISAHGHDDDGNLAQVNVWKNSQPFAFGGGGNGTDANSGNPTSDLGSQTVTFTAQTIDSAGATSPIISWVVTITVANSAPAISWNNPPGSAASGQSYAISAHGHDDDGNLAQVNVWKNSQPFAFGGGGNGTDADSGNPTNDIGPQTITYTAQAVDAAGAMSPLISHTVAIAAPLSAQYTLTTNAGPGGSVSPGGTFNAGTTATVTAAPDAIHDFAGWSGDASGASNPLGVLMDRNKAVQANFVLKNFTLTTSASTGGSVTPGGTYPYGTTLTISAAADSTHRFTGWAGDASGSVPTVAVTMNAAKSVQAIFAAKTPQSISFSPPGDHAIDAPPFALNATASSGLPVSYTVLSGPATLSGNQVQITGPGAVTIQASQPGDSVYLPAPSIAQTFNAGAAVVLKYRAASRVFLQSERNRQNVPFVLENP